MPSKCQQKLYQADFLYERPHKTALLPRLDALDRGAMRYRIK